MQDTKTSDKFDLTVYFLIVALGILQFLLRISPIIVRRGAGLTNSFPTKPARESFCGDILLTYAGNCMECK